MKTTNYTEKEKMILASLVRVMGEEIENKKTDAVSLQKKQEIWDKLSKHFNSQPEINTKRSSKQLKKLWANLKQKKRTENTKHIVNILKTGGGTAEEEPSDILMELVDVAAPNTDMFLECDWDSTEAFKRSQNNCTMTSTMTTTASTSTSSTISTSAPTSIDINNDCEELYRQKNIFPLNTEKSTISARPSEIPISSSALPREMSSIIQLDALRPMKAKPKRKIFLKEDEEKALRITKIKEAIQQQNELHQIRMLSAKAEFFVATANARLVASKLTTEQLAEVQEIVKIK